MSSDARPRDLCWIASYPRSGNTFFRISLSNVLFGAGKEVGLDQDIIEVAFFRRSILATACEVLRKEVGHDN